MDVMFVDVCGVDVLIVSVVTKLYGFEDVCGVDVLTVSVVTKLYGMRICMYTWVCVMFEVWMC